MLKIVFWFSIGLIFYSYFGYFLILWIIFKLRRKEQLTNVSYLPSISLLISAYNEQDVIADKILNCRELDYPREKLEILLGLDGSNDNTEVIVKNSQNGFIDLHAFKTRRGKAAVLNDLVRKAEGEILIFSDANTMYDSDAIQKLIRHFTDPTVGGVCGKLVLQDRAAMDAGSRGEKLYWNYESQIKYLEGHIQSVLGANGAIYGIRKQLYERLPEHKVIMDDFLIPLRVAEKGYRVAYDNEAIGKEHTSVSVWDEFKRKIRISTANFNAIREISHLLNPARGYIALGLWSHKVIRWFIPFLAVSLLISNILLLGEPLYNITFAIQILFYFCALVGAVLNSFGIYRNLLSLVFYFFMVNLALLIGFYRFLAKSHKPVWDPVKR